MRLLLLLLLPAALLIGCATQPMLSATAEEREEGDVVTEIRDITPEFTVESYPDLTVIEDRGHGTR
jgi:hypothetical protein